MIEKRFIELMNGEIDGVNSPDESAALRAHLDSNEEARRHYEQLRGVASMFAVAGNVAPPADLNRAIMQSIDGREALRAASAARGVRASLRGIFSPGKRLAYSFAAGLALGLVVLVILLNVQQRPDTLDHSDLYGALGEKRAGGPVIAEESVSLAIDDVSGSIGVRYLASSIVVMLDLDASREIETTLRADAACVTLKSFGRSGVAVAFRDEAGAHPDVSISISAGGGRIFERTIVGDKANAIQK